MGSPCCVPSVDSMISVVSEWIQVIIAWSRMNFLKIILCEYGRHVLETVESALRGVVPSEL